MAWGSLHKGQHRVMEISPQMSPMFPFRVLMQPGSHREPQPSKGGSGNPKTHGHQPESGSPATGGGQEADPVSRSSLVINPEGTPSTEFC